MAREIRKLTAADIESYLEVYLNAYPAFKELDEECTENFRQKFLFQLREDKDVETVGLFDDGVLLATMKIVKFDMNLYGKMQRAYGLMSLAVHPLHKKKGAALEMIRYIEAYTREHGGLVLLLLPFRFDFYKNMGYGYGTRLDEYTIRTSGLPVMRDMSGLAMLGQEDVDEVLACYRAFAERNHGCLDKYDEEARDMRADTQVRRIGYRKDGKLVGYVAYRYVDGSEVNFTINRILVEEMIYEDGACLRKLLGYLALQADLAQTITLRTGEPDFLHLLENPADINDNYIPFGCLQTNVEALGTMFKVMDPAAFVAATSYRPCGGQEITVAFTYTDMMDKEEKTFAVKAGGGTWKIADAAAADLAITCTQAEMSSILLGSAGIAALHRLGAIEVSDASKVPAADLAFYAPQRPFTNNDY